MMTKVTLGEEHLSCGMVMQDSSCGDEQAENPGCCDNEYTQVTTDDNFTKARLDVKFDTHFVVAFVSIFMLKTPFLEEALFAAYIDYNPPPLIKDIPVLYETFLI
jgi:hypothetical protein